MINSRDFNNSLFQSALSLEEAAKLSCSRPYLPYNPHPVISKSGEKDSFYPIEPLKVFDNVYWMGSRDVGVLVIDTGDGFIMIDSGSNEVEGSWISDSFSKMGLDPAGIKLIVVSHEHFDHYGGVSFFLEKVCPEAKIAMSRTGWNFLQTVPTEFAFTEPRPHKVDILIDDGICLKLGSVKLLCVLTPGHSAGCLSFIFNSSLHGEELSVGVMGGSVPWPDFPEARLYENSVEYFKLYTDLAGCNAFSAVHQEEDDLNRVRDYWTKGNKHPWVCSKEDFDSAYLQTFREKADDTIYSGYMQPYMMPVMSDNPPSPEGSPLPPREK